MTFEAFKTSGVIDAATVASGAAAPTLLITATQQALIITIDNSGNQPLQIFLNRNTPPAGAATPDMVVLAGRTSTLSLRNVGRNVQPTIYGRFTAGATGTVAVNLVL